MQFTTTVTQKGQATIPAPIRKKLDIKPNSKIVFELKSKGEVSLKPATDFFTLQGSIKSNKPFDIEAMDKSIEGYFKKNYAKSPH